MSKAAISLVFAFTAVVAIFPSGVRASDGVEFFEKRIRPLLAETCFDCHHPDNKIKGELRLDSREGWMTGGELGPVIVPGKPEESLLIKAVRFGDPKLQMPPKRKLSDAQIADLEAWVKMGAPDPRTGPAVAKKKKNGIDLEAGRKFWSFQPVRKPAVPAVKDAAWPRGSIDRFILAKQEAQGLKPAPDADKEALIRRAYLALTGLPPTPEQIDGFLADPRPDAFARVVDGLLASPHYGERWGRHWLDVARFAESSGGGRTLLFKDAWRFRDYVIESFNRDVPFDQFIREQLAGDLLPFANSEQRGRQITATAFLALGPTNYEEQDKRQLRFDVIDEQLDTLGKGLLGMTIGCARCHDHKFDPIPQKDYYALAGIFASTRTLFNYTDNVARWIDTPLPMEGEKEVAARAHEQKVAALQKQVEVAKKAASKTAATIAAVTTKPGNSLGLATLPGIVVDDSQAKVVGEWKHSTHSQSFIGEGYLHDLDQGKGEKTITFVPKIPKAGRYEVRLAYPSYPSRATNVSVTVFHADGENEVVINQTEPPSIAGRFASLGKYRFEKDGAGYVLVSNNGTKGYVNVDAVQFIPEEELATADAGLTSGDPKADRANREASQRVRELEAEMKKLVKSGPARTVAMAVHEGEADEIGGTEVRVRGIVHNKGPSVPRGFLQVASLGKTPVLPAKESGRRELAEWIVSPENPLTARVTVNRTWHWLFGAGLVRTTDNFGVTGETPSHPELLDYLADHLIASGWSMKMLVREIVLSRTWQVEAGAATAADPDNRLLSHFPRQRLDAEQIRDTILAVSGKLDLRIGGLNILGAGGIDANNFSAQNTEYGYVYADTRRSVYTPAFRAKRLELFEVFDFGNINQPIGQRNVSTVAPQALYLLNSPFVMEQARVAAQRALADTRLDDAARLEHAYRTALGRLPSSAERATLMRFLNSTGGDSSDEARRIEAWSHVFQTLFACVDFRYLN